MCPDRSFETVNVLQRGFCKVRCTAFRDANLLFSPNPSLAVTFTRKSRSTPAKCREIFAKTIVSRSYCHVSQFLRGYTPRNSTERLQPPQECRRGYSRSAFARRAAARLLIDLELHLINASVKGTSAICGSHRSPSRGHRLTAGRSAQATPTVVF